MKKILLCVSGGIACYKSLELVRLLKERHFDVKVVMSKAASKFITPLSFQSLSQNTVATELFDLNAEHEINHIALAQSFDLILVSPATANCISKFALGICDDLLSTLLIAADKPIMIAPAMNTQMWQNQAVQKNLQTLKSRNVLCIEPIDGLLACGTYGKGKMAETNTIAKQVEQFFQMDAMLKKKLHNKTIVITAGATREYLDPIRFISNNSSGKMGFAFAEVAKKYGAIVHLIVGHSHQNYPSHDFLYQTERIEDMAEISFKLLPEAAIFIKTAAVGDFKAVIKNETKIKKSQKLSIELEKTSDILSELGMKKKKHQILLGFAAETNNPIDHGKEKLKNKNLDYIFVNRISDENKAFGEDENEGVLLGKKDLQVVFQKQNKIQLAEKILKSVVS